MAKSEHTEGDQMAKDNHQRRRRVYGACMFCPCTQAWEIKQVFLCAKDAAVYCDEKMRYPLKFSKPVEYWHVREFELEHGDVVWGCECARQPDYLGAPDCV